MRINNDQIDYTLACRRTNWLHAHWRVAASVTTARRKLAGRRTTGGTHTRRAWLAPTLPSAHERLVHHPTSPHDCKPTSHHFANHPFNCSHDYSTVQASSWLKKAAILSDWLVAARRCESCSPGKRGATSVSCVLVLFTITTIRTSLAVRRMVMMPKRNECVGVQPLFKPDQMPPVNGSIDHVPAMTLTYRRAEHRAYRVARVSFERAHPTPSNHIQPNICC